MWGGGRGRLNRERRGNMEYLSGRTAGVSVPVLASPEREEWRGAGIVGSSASRACS